MATQRPVFAENHQLNARFEGDNYVAGINSIPRMMLMKNRVVRLEVIDNNPDTI
jgi:hypothetical protein